MNETIEKPKDERKLRGRHSCPFCGSSDSLGYYESNARCYGSCDKTFWYEKGEKIETLDFEEEIVTIDHIRNLPFRGRKDRDVTREVAEFYGATSEIDESGNPTSWYFPWTQKGKTIAYKQKTPTKEFYLKGDTKLLKNKDTELFGQSLFSKGGLTLLITEGELDALSIQRAYLQKYKRTYPVVSMFNSTDKSLIVNNLDYIKSFKKIIIWGDKDEAGLKAVKEACKAIGAGKVYTVDTKYKDANEALLAEGHKFVINSIWSASLWNPSGFVSGMDIWKKFKEHRNKPATPFPECLNGLNLKLDGIRVNEITLFTSGTGSGKSTIIKEILIKITEVNPESKIGIVSLEEEVGETSGKLIEMDLRHELVKHEDDDYEDPEQLKSFKKLFLKPDGSERVVIVDHQGSLGDDSLMDKMNQLASMGCKYIILDHITIAVSEGNAGLSGNEATDKMMSDLLKLVKSNEVWLGLISHLRKVGSGAKSFEEGHMPSLDDIKGSGSIKQVSFDIIAFSRNMTAESEEERNTIKLSVLKARYTGRTGPAGSAYYDMDTKRLKAIDPDSNLAIDNMFDSTKGGKEIIGL
jgi:twinkle protein